jgi:hypothetical protein
MMITLMLISVSVACVMLYRTMRHWVGQIPDVNQDFNPFMSGSDVAHAATEASHVVQQATRLSPATSFQLENANE